MIFSRKKKMFNYFDWKKSCKNRFQLFTPCLMQPRMLSSVMQGCMHCWSIARLAVHRDPQAAFPATLHSTETDSSLWCCLGLFCSMCAGLVFLCNTTLVYQSSRVLWSLCIVTLPFSASTSSVIPASFTNLVSVNAVLASWSFRKTLNSMWSRNNFQKTTCDLSQLDFQPFTTTPCTR